MIPPSACADDRLKRAKRGDFDFSIFIKGSIPLSIPSSPFRKRVKRDCKPLLNREGERGLRRTAPVKCLEGLPFMWVPLGGELDASEEFVERVLLPVTKVHQLLRLRSLK